MLSIEENRQAYHRLLAEKTLLNLAVRGIDGEYIEDKDTALQRILALIPHGSSVSKGGSATIDELRVIEALHNSGCQIIDPNSGKDGVEKDAIAHDAIAADVYLMSANAISATGEIVNIDVIGNRVSALCYGPKRILMVVGINKLTQDLPSAIQRAKGIASSMTVLAHNQRFEDFDGLDSAGEHAGNQMLVTTGSVISGRLHVIIVGEQLGY